MAFRDKNELQELISGIKLERNSGSITAERLGNILLDIVDSVLVLDGKSGLSENDLTDARLQLLQSALQHANIVDDVSGGEGSSADKVASPKAVKEAIDQAVATIMGQPDADVTINQLTEVYDFLAQVNEQPGGLKAMLDGKAPITHQVPSGGIIMWSGVIDAVPNGWALCDGKNSTPDLRGRFIVGYNPNDGDYNAIGDTGGEKRHTLTIDEMPRHSHYNSTGKAGIHNHSMSSDGNHIHGYTGDHGDGYPDGSGDRVGEGYTNSYVRQSAREYSGTHSHTIYDGGEHYHSIPVDGGSQPHENRPPYYTLAFIMKL